MLDLIRRRLRLEAGMTLPELLVSLTLLSIVVSVFLAVLVSVQSGLTRQTDRAQSNDQARLAVEELDREIRSGNVLYNPATVGELWSDDAVNGIYPGMALLIYTQTNAVTRNPGNRCVQWRIQSGQLERRDWAITWRSDPATLVGGWRIVADHVVNQTATPQVQAFALDPDPAKGNRTVDIKILTNQSERSGANVQIQSSVTGRNTEYGYPNNVCSDIPPY